MFSLRSFSFFGGRKQLLKKETATESPEMPSVTSEITLISTEDIYRELATGTLPSRDEQVLLLKKGIEVASDQWSKLMKNGASPSQFRIKGSNGTHGLVSLPIMTNPIFEAPGTLVRSIRSQKRVLVLDPAQKSLKRLIDCLFICGFQLNNLHPVRVPAHLNWALNKYRPHLLVVDYHLSEQSNGLQLLQSIGEKLHTFEQVILTVPTLSTLSHWEVQRLKSFCQLWDVQMLERPVSRFALKQILDRTITEQSIRETAVF